MEEYGGNRRVFWTPAPEPEIIPVQVSVAVQTLEAPVPVRTVVKTSATQADLVQPKLPRNGNGHKAEKSRSLLDPERDFMRKSFIRKDGIIDTDDCVTLKSGMAEEVGIFQVTGSSATCIGKSIRLIYS